MRGIAAYGAYVPYWRLDRKAIATALGAPSGSGTRSVASYDEDTTSLGVEAARAAVRAAPHLPPGVLSEPVAFGSATAEFLERWRLPGEPASRQWEERFGEHVYVPLGESAVTEALKQAGVTAPSVTQWVIAGPHARAAKRLAASLGATKGSIVDDLATVIGNTGTAHAGLLLAHVLDTATPDALIAVVSLADGCDVTVWRATSAIAARRPATTVATQLRGGGAVGHATFLTWRGFLKREPPRRPDPQPPQAPPAARAEAWTVAFTGSRCQACGARHLPPQRVCVKCHAMDRMAPERLADFPATI